MAECVWRRGLLGLLMAATACIVVALAAACGEEAPQPAASSETSTASPVAVPFPETAAGRQLEWVVGKLNAGAPLSDAEIAAHFSPSFLQQVSADQLRTALAQVGAAGPFRLGEIIGPNTETSLVARLDGAAGTLLKTSVAVEPPSNTHMAGLLFQPYAPVAKPTSWEEVDERLAKLAGQASLLAIEVGESGTTPGTTLHAREAERPGAIGSAFKLYVLAALAEAVDEGTAAWSERLAVRDDWKSLPSGEMRNEQAGTRFTLRHFAEQMISVSDNTAMDHVMGRVGRGAVEAQLEALGMADAAASLPFLSTREMFALKLSAPESLRERYIAAATEERRQLLKEVEGLSVDLDDVTGWTSPRDIDTLEWFASPADLVRAMERLREMAERSGLEPVRAILSKNPGITLDASVWKYAAYKGGSEPGVLSLVWLLERADGRTFALAVVLNDASRDIEAAEAVAVAEGAVDLMAAVR